ncbi:hypothetical protein [Amycolatopsis taiwanensis]|uniref:Uncharacterized protein n=1 Tax=Amycolatopsis taiwanensis TaxID=342230 RepID=A0A9W6VGM8_9PSEU|nr:hypothetical protein [Amycolatopsis taiwanensis]GLY66144.1 hypothetical protein Atai01_27630 [Amycolatopsis taiwanensis]
MTWHDFYRRRDVIDAVLREARRDPSAPLPFADVPGARDTFGDEENLLLALQHKWTLVFGGRLETELLDVADTVDAILRAWHSAVGANPTLRAVLDANLDRYPSLRSAHEAQQRTLAVTAGFAGIEEPTTEITRVGATIEALVRQGTPAGHASDLVSKPRRMLAPSG